MELTFQVAIFIQTEKLVPQPQDEVALGLLTLKAWPIRSSVKSISAPGQEIQRHRIDQDLGAVLLQHQVVVQPGFVQGEIILKAGTAAAGHRQPQHGAAAPSPARMAAMRWAARAETVTGMAVMDGTLGMDERHSLM